MKWNNTKTQILSKFKGESKIFNSQNNLDPDMIGKIKKVNEIYQLHIKLDTILWRDEFGIERKVGLTKNSPKWLFETKAYEITKPFSLPSHKYITMQI
jgi:hypothetical protein